MSAEIEKLTEQINRIAEGEGYRLVVPELNVDLDVAELARAYLAERREPREGWNEAIEAAAQICDSFEPHGEGGYVARKAAQLIRERLQASPSPSREAVTELQTFAESFAANDEGLHLAPENWNRMRELILALKSPEPEPSNAKPNTYPELWPRSAPAPEMGEYVRDGERFRFLCHERAGWLSRYAPTSDIFHKVKGTLANMRIGIDRAMLAAPAAAEKQGKL